MQSEVTTRHEHQQQLTKLRQEVSGAFDKFARKQTTIAELVKELNIMGVDVAVPEETPEPSTPSLQQPQPAVEADTLEAEPRYVHVPLS